MTVKDISLDIVPCYIRLATNKERANKYLKKYHGLSDEFNTAGKTLIISKNSNLHTLLVYIDLDTEKYDIYQIKGLLVHELSHVVTEIFKAYDFNCDETRSYMLQSLYVKAVKIVDKEIADAE